MESNEINIELSKILAKAMQCSFKKKEVQETIERIIDKMDKLISNDFDESKVRELRKEFEEIRKSFYGLK